MSLVCIISKETEQSSILYYIHDPMCSWCWAFRPGWQVIQDERPVSLSIRLILGGLAADSSQTMSKEMQANIRAIWQTIERQVPGSQFNYNFWIQCHPRRSTYPACRAVIAATAQDIEYQALMILAIQEAYYLHAQNPSDDPLLTELADSIGLNTDRFRMDLNTSKTRQALIDQIAFSRTLGIHSFPSLVLEHHQVRQIITIDYNNPALVLNQLYTLLK